MPIGTPPGRQGYGGPSGPLDYPEGVKRLAVPGIATVVILALVALLIYGVAAKDSSSSSLDTAVKRGQRPVAPGATRALPALTGGGEHRLADYRGKVVVLNFWASWCTPCAAEAPLMQQAQQTLGARGTVLGATYNDVPGDSLGFERKHHLSYPSVRDVGLKLAQDYNTHALPETFVIDRNGRVVAISRGQVSARFLRNAVQDALGS
jgi:cytochrome c biogenesis protein CcmG, thiol:disulfide interchange protein DsbE